MVSMNLPVVVALSMALNHSESLSNGGLQNSMVFREKFHLTWKNVNLDFILDEENLVVVNF